MELIREKVEEREGDCDTYFKYMKGCHVEDLFHVAPRGKLGIEGRRLRKLYVGLRPYFNVRNSFRAAPWWWKS